MIELVLPVEDLLKQRLDVRRAAHGVNLEDLVVEYREYLVGVPYVERVRLAVLHDLELEPFPFGLQLVERAFEGILLGRDVADVLDLAFVLLQIHLYER